MPTKKSSRRNEQNIVTSHAFVVGRFGIIFLISTIIAIAIASKLFSTTVLHRDAWVAMGDRSLADTGVVEPFRGEILASDGSILATNLYYFNVMMDLRADGFKIIEFSEAIPELADSLAACFPKRTKEEWLEKIQKQMDRPKSKRTRNFVICKAVPQKTVDRIKKFPFFRDFRKSNQTGLKIEPVMKRAYPFGEMARLSIGRVGQTAIDPTVHGRSGLECALDSLLYGTPGITHRRLSNRGTKNYVAVPAVDGYNVYTTIDITMQDILENELGQMLLNAQAEWGSAMLMEVATGDIKAISNLELDKKSATPRYIEALNRCVQAYEPGSVMKVITMAVALEKGFAKPVTRTFSIGRHATICGRGLSDTHSPAVLPIDRFIEYSSNIGMAKMTVPYYEHNPRQFRKDLEEMGFFDRFNTGIATERRPMFISNPSKLDLSRMCFGYSTMIPPLYTCAFYNAIANDGKFVRPRLVKGLRTPEGVDSIIPVSYVREQMMSAENAATLRRMMRGVVWGEGGTAKVLKNDLVEIAGKTGTCKIALEDTRPRVDANGDSIKLPPFRGGYKEGHYRVAFCGFFPFENPKYTCIVVINDPKPPFRGPAVSSGMVLKNVALKLYARSMLNDNPEFRKQPNPASSATLYSSFNDDRNRKVLSDLKIEHPHAIRRPAKWVEGQVPDVKGVSIREALTRLEAAGYPVDFSGVGYVYAQQPEAGTVAKPGTTVKLNLRYD